MGREGKKERKGRGGRMKKGEEPAIPIKNGSGCGSDQIKRINHTVRLLSTTVQANSCENYTVKLNRQTDCSQRTHNSNINISRIFYGDVTKIGIITSLAFAGVQQRMCSSFEFQKNCDIKILSLSLICDLNHYFLLSC